jgi:hypothetical protein
MIVYVSLKFYRMIYDEIEMILNNLMSIDLYNHLLMNLTLLCHLMDRIEVPYPIEMNRNYLGKKELKEIHSNENNHVLFSPALFSSSLKPSLAKPEMFMYSMRI